MKVLPIRIGALALATQSLAADDPIAVRQALMDNNGTAAAVAGGILVAALKAATRRARPYAERGPDFGARPRRGAATGDTPSGEIGAPLEELSVAQRLAGSILAAQGVAGAIATGPTLLKVRTHTFSATGL